MRHLLISALLSLTLAACATPAPPNPINSATRSSLNLTGYDFSWQIPAEQSSSPANKAVQSDFEAKLRQKLRGEISSVYGGTKPVTLKIRATNLYLPGLGMNWLVGASPQVDTEVKVIDKTNGQTLGTYKISAILVNTHGIISGLTQRAMSRGNALANIFLTELKTTLSRK